MSSRSPASGAPSSGRSAAPSFLDTKDITRQVAGTSKDAGSRVLEHPARRAWLRQLEPLTVAHREQRARGLERQALKREHFGAVERKRTRRMPNGETVDVPAARRDGHLDGSSERSARQSGVWHRLRARGHRRRFRSVDDCTKADVLRIECSCCGTLDEQPGTCGASLLCLRCRGKRARRLRARFLQARKVKLAQARARGLLWRGRKGGRYGERLVTLTPPHREHDTVRGRIELVLAAWKYFLKSLNAWARAQGVELEFVRVLEWTIGSDSRGHPHLHLWAFSTFLPQDLLSAWWRWALERAGLQLGDQEELLAVDIRACGGDAGVAQELVKYMCKDIGADGQYVDPAIFADVYAALDGNRAAQGSRGFLGLGDAAPSCRHCGATYSLRVRIVPNDAERTARSREELDALTWLRVAAVAFFTST
jgi:hypothetical protein